MTIINYGKNFAFYSKSKEDIIKLNTLIECVFDSADLCARLRCKCLPIKEWKEKNVNDLCVINLQYSILVSYPPHFLRKYPITLKDVLKLVYQKSDIKFLYKGGKKNVNCF